MMTMILAAALAAAQAAPAAPANPNAQHGQAAPMDHSKMDQGKMDHSQMKSDCCKKGADGKMECTMMDTPAGESAHEGHKGQ